MTSYLSSYNGIIDFVVSWKITETFLTNAVSRNYESQAKHVRRSVCLCVMASCAEPSHGSLVFTNFTVPHTSQ